MGTAKTSAEKKISYFIGVDVSKNKLDFAVLMDRQFLLHRVIDNNQEAVTAFMEELGKLERFRIQNALFCMEQTGYYCNPLLEALQKLKATIVVENPVQIKSSLGVLRGKNDKVDAIRIAQYAQRHRDELRLWVPRREVISRLVNLFSMRNRLLGVSVALKMPLKEELKFIKKGAQLENKLSCRESLKAITADLAQIDQKIASVIAQDSYLEALMEIICSVPSIGPVTALQIIICTNEFRDISDPKKFACYAGVAPFKNESGGSAARAKVSHIANKKMKSLLHICAMGSLRYDKEMQSYYKRKTADEGKNGMVVINAIRYKLILRVFACVRQGRLFVKDYHRDNILTGELIDAAGSETY